jgi:hypothetical protein
MTIRILFPHSNSATSVLIENIQKSKTTFNTILLHQDPRENVLHFNNPLFATGYGKCYDRKGIFYWQCLLSCKVFPIIFQYYFLENYNSQSSPFKPNLVEIANQTIVQYLKVLSNHLNWGARLDSFDRLLNTR